MELNSLGAAREDTHGTPEKLRGKMYSFFCFFFLLSFSFSFTLVPRACHSPTPSAFSATSLPFSTLKETILAPSAPSPRPFQLLELVCRYSSGYATTTRTATFLIPLLSTSSSSSSTLLFGVNGRSTLIRVLFLGQICLGKCVYIYIYAHACMIPRSFTRLPDRKYEGNRRNLIATVHSNDFKTRHGCDRWKLTGTCLPFLFLSLSLLFSFFLFFFSFLDGSVSFLDTIKRRKGKDVKRTL